MNIRKTLFTFIAGGLLVSSTTGVNAADPAAAAAHGNKGNELAQAAKYDEAIAEFTKAIELSPGDSRLYNDRGRVYRAMAKFTEAMADFDKGIALSPKSDTGYVERGQTEMA